MSSEITRTLRKIMSRESQILKEQERRAGRCVNQHKKFYSRNAKRSTQKKEDGKCMNVICLHLSVTTFLCHSDGIFCEMLSFQFDCPRTLTRKNRIRTQAHTHTSVPLKMYLTVSTNTLFQINVTAVDFPTRN